MKVLVEKQLKDINIAVINSEKEINMELIDDNWKRANTEVLREIDKNNNIKELVLTLCTVQICEFIHHISIQLKFLASILWHTCYISVRLTNLGRF